MIIVVACIFVTFEVMLLLLAMVLVVLMVKVCD